MKEDFYNDEDYEPIDNSEDDGQWNYDNEDTKQKQNINQMMLEILKRNKGR